MDLFSLYQEASLPHDIEILIALPDRESGGARQEFVAEGALLRRSRLPSHARLESAELVFSIQAQSPYSGKNTKVDQAN